MLSWMNHKLESRLLGKISTTSDMQMISHYWQKAKRNSRPPEGKRGERKSWLKLNIKKKTTKNNNTPKTKN